MNLTAPSSKRTESALPWLAPLAISVLTLAVFLPALRDGFVWDDLGNFVDNPNYRGLGFKELRWMLTTNHLGPYQPLSWLSYALDYKIWGMNPFGYHLTNILIHAANAVLFYFLSLRFLAAEPASGEDRLTAVCAALLFSLHPLRVETVAWVSARGHALSAFFFLLTLLLWLRAVEPARPARRLWSALACSAYVLALLSKAMAITLPAVLVLLDIYPLRRLPGDPRQWLSPGRRGLWREKLPFFATALLFIALESFARLKAGALAPLSEVGLVERSAQALFGLAYYLEKTLIPLRLSPDCLWHWPMLRAYYGLAAIPMLGLLGVLIALRRRWPAGLAAFACYAITLIPVLGLLKIGHETAADRYTYLPCLGWALLAGAGLRKLGKVRLPFAAVLLAVLSCLSWRQIQVWHDSISLWRSVLKIDPLHTMARGNLGIALLEQNRYNEAALLWQEQMRLVSTDAGTKKSLSRLVSEEWGSPPDQAKLYNDAGADLLQHGEIDKAAWYFGKALKLNPELARARNNLGLVLYRQGRIGEAVGQYKECLRLAPDSYEARNNLGIALARLGRFDEAIAQFEAALRIQPDYEPARASLRLARRIKNRR